MTDMMEHVRETDITLDDGRVLHAYDTGGDSADTRRPLTTAPPRRGPDRTAPVPLRPSA